MTKEELVRRFKGGLCVDSDESYYLNVDWLIDERETQDDVLKFIAYDANLCPLPNLSTWRSKERAKENIDVCLKKLKDYDVEVWLDDVKIKAKKENK